MFRKPQAPQRRPFNLTNEQIAEDIEAVKCSREEKEKLFACLDEKLPSEKQYAELETFLKGTRDLEQILQVLKSKASELKELAEQLRLSVETVRRKADEVSEENEERDEA